MNDKRLFQTSLAAVLLLAAAIGAGEAWQELPALPDREGFAGMFAGVSNGALIAAGGANFPEKKPWEGGAKVWHDAIYVLERPDGAWKAAGKLPRPAAYGVSVSTPLGVVCCGGGDAKAHFREVFALQWDGKAIQTAALPDLPRPCAFMCGAGIGNTVYLAGCIEEPDATQAHKTFWELDISAPQPLWKELDPWPGPERMLAVAGVQGGSFFLFSGTSLSAGPDGKPARKYLTDAYQFTPGKGWKRIADLPRATVAAPSPAFAWDKNRLAIVSGDDGTKLGFQPPEKHPGFPRDVLCYDVAANTWTRAGEAPFSLATAPALKWKETLVIVSGEVRPGVRSPNVWSATK